MATKAKEPKAVKAKAAKKPEATAETAPKKRVKKVPVDMEALATAAREAVRTMEESRQGLKFKTRMFYDLQRMRLQAAGRTYERPDGTTIQLHDVDVKILNARSDELMRAEKSALNDVADHLKTIPFYNDVLSDKVRYRGVGPTMAAVILSELEFERQDTPSKAWAFCLTPGQLIMTDDGAVPVEMIQVGDRVIDAVGHLTDVVDTFQREYEGPVYTIKATKMRAVTCTGEHPLRIARKSANGDFVETWVKAENVVPGDYAVVPRFNEEGVPPKEFDLTRHVAPIARGSLEQSRLPVNERTAKLFGRFVADGSTTIYRDGKYARGRCMLSIGDGKPIENILSILHEELRCNVTTADMKKYGSGAATQIQFGRLAMAREFRAQFGDDAATKRIPGWLMTAPLSLVRAFIEGYMDGDGCVVPAGKSAGTRWCNSVSEGLIQQLQVLWTRLNDLPGTSISRRAGTKGKFRDKEYELRDRFNLWLGVPKKAKTFEPVLDRGDRFYCYVKKVTARPYSGLVHNFQTKSETYCVANVAVHNCGLAPIPARRCLKCHSVVVPDENKATGTVVYTHPRFTGFGPPKKGAKPVDEDAPVKVKKGQCAPLSVIQEEQTYASGQAMRPVKGEKLKYNSWLRTKLVGVLGPVLIKCDSPWREFYDKYKKRKQDAGWGRNDAHRHQAAIRFMVKQLLLDIWKSYRIYHHLPVREPYSVEYQGKKHVGGTGNISQKLPGDKGRPSREDEMDALIEAELAIASGE
jgi:hypothetical protein